MKDPALWDRLRAYDFDAASPGISFAAKLADAEGWTRGKAARVVDEYRRFLYLTQVDGRRLTPSVAVDKAWHQHLTHTRDYWDRLCAEVLKQPLHHNPAGEQEREKMQAQFADTLEIYAREFGTPPPDDIWRKANSRGRPQLWKVSGVLAVLAIIGSAFADGTPLQGFASGLFIASMVLFALTVLLVGGGGNSLEVSSGDCDGGGGCGD